MRRSYFSTFELLLLALFAALVVVGNVALRLPVKMPGHSGLAWMAILITSRGAVPKFGAAATVGVLSGVLGAFLGVGDKGGLDTLLSYAAAGAVVEAGAGIAAANALGSALAGLAGKLAKFGVKVLLQVWVG